MLKLLRRFVADRSGSFAILTAFLLPVALVATGIAVDYGLALTSSQRLTAAANGAVLSALSEVQARSDRDELVTEEQIEEFIRGFFAAHSANIPLTSVTSVTPRATIDRNEISASIGFRADYTTALMNLFGRPTVPISNTARAVVTLRSYINVNILVDTSQSMGIGATTLDQQKVAQATGCAFACHINQSRGNSSYDRARANGANMRIDVARDAVVAAIDAMAANAQFAGQVTVSLYRFSNVPTTIQLPTSNLGYARTRAASEIQLDMVGGGTNQQEALRVVGNQIPASGTGRTANDRIQYIIVITDGVENAQAWQPNYWYRHPSNTPNAPSQVFAQHEVNYALNTNACSTLAQRGVETYFIYTEYLVPTSGTISQHDRNRFNFVTNSLFPIIPSRMQTCTGAAAKVLRADTPEQINRTFVELARRLSSPLRLY